MGAPRRDPRTKQTVPIKDKQPHAEVTTGERNLIMKKTINGRKYDSDTAKAVAEFSNDIGEFTEVIETLHQKRGGEFFLHCMGGPNTIYGEPRGENWRGYGQSIRPMTAAEAEEWEKSRSEAIGNFERF